MSLASCYKAKKMAKGGHVKGYDYDSETDSYQPNKDRRRDMDNSKGVHQGHTFAVKQGTSSAGANARSSKEFEKHGRTAEHKITKENAINEHKRVLGEMHEMRGQDRKNLAEGGEVEDTESQPSQVAGANNRAAEMTKSMRSAFNYDKDYAHGGMACKNCGYAEGGMVSEEEASGYQEMPEPYHEEDDMISEIMHERASGAEANDDAPLADSEPAQYDDLVKDDDMEFHETAANSGDEIGNEEHDEEDEDMIGSIMKSRKKKDRNPSPA